jgi:hypothetical protein
MTTSTISRAQSVSQRSSSLVRKSAAQSPQNQAKGRLSEPSRLSQEAKDILGKANQSKDEKESKAVASKADAKETKDSKKDESKELGTTEQLKEKLLELENELAELRKQLEAQKEAKKDEASKDDQKSASSAGGASAAGGSSDKGPTVSNPEAPAGFLWKPVSDSDGKLAVLLPPSMTGKVTGVRILSPQGDQLATGKSGGVANGGREHFRFDRAGGNFPSGSKVVIQFKNGGQQEVTIQQTGVRNEGSKKG